MSAFVWTTARTTWLAAWGRLTPSWVTRTARHWFRSGRPTATWTSTAIWRWRLGLFKLVGNYHSFDDTKNIHLGFNGRNMMKWWNDMERYGSISSSQNGCAFLFKRFQPFQRRCGTRLRSHGWSRRTSARRSYDRRPDVFFFFLMLLGRLAMAQVLWYQQSIKNIMSVLNGTSINYIVFFFYFFLPHPKKMNFLSRGSATWTPGRGKSWVHQNVLLEVAH